MAMSAQTKVWIGWLHHDFFDRLPASGAADKARRI